MLCWAYAPSTMPAPNLYARFTQVRELGLRWEDVGGIDEDEINDLVKMINIEREAMALKARVAKATQGK